MIFKLCKSTLFIELLLDFRLFFTLNFDNPKSNNPKF